MKPIAPFQKDFESPVIPNPKSMIKIANAINTDAITTIIALLCNSFHVGHETL